MTTKLIVEYTAEEKQHIIIGLRAVALAHAKLWDILREIETDHACSIEIDVWLASELAADHEVPPPPEDLDDEFVWDSFLQQRRGIGVKNLRCPLCGERCITDEIKPDICNLLCISCGCNSVVFLGEQLVTVGYPAAVSKSQPDAHLGATEAI